MERTILRIDAALSRQIDALAEQRGCSSEEIVRVALETYAASSNGNSIDDNSQAFESLFDRLDRAGLIGCIDDGPSDLSTNPKYFEGMGE